MNQYKVVGIDIGTTFSRVSVWKNQNINIIANDLGNRKTPTCVAFIGNDSIVGEVAKSKLEGYPQSTFFGFKRMLGQSYQKLKAFLDSFSFPVANRSGQPAMKCTLYGEKKYFSPEEVTSMMLVSMKKIGETCVEKVTDVVLTVPAYFGETQRESFQNAATLAGLNVVQLISEPVAACIAFRLDWGPPKTVLVFDFGGSTLNATLLKIHNSEFSIKATSGYRNLGGEDIDDRLLLHFKHEFETQSGIDITDDPKALRRLRLSCEKAKHALSSLDSTQVDVECLAKGEDFQGTLTRAMFEEICADIFPLIFEPIEAVLRSCGIDKKEVNDLVLVGGSSYIPKIQTILRNFFDDKSPHVSNPDETVVTGAAILAASLQSKAETMPKKHLHLGIGVKGGEVHKLVENIDTLPYSMKAQFTTAHSFQEQAEVKLYEGNCRLAAGCNLLGSIEIPIIYNSSGIQPKYFVNLHININGEIHLSIENPTMHIQKAMDVIVSLSSFTPYASNQNISAPEIQLLRNSKMCLMDFIISEEKKMFENLKAAHATAKKTNTPLIVPSIGIIGGPNSIKESFIEISRNFISREKPLTSKKPFKRNPPTTPQLLEKESYKEIIFVTDPQLGQNKPSRTTPCSYVTIPDDRPRKKRRISNKPEINIVPIDLDASSPGSDCYVIGGKSTGSIIDLANSPIEIDCEPTFID